MKQDIVFTMKCFRCNRLNCTLAFNNFILSKYSLVIRKYPAESQFLFKRGSLLWEGGWGGR